MSSLYIKCRRYIVRGKFYHEQFWHQMLVPWLTYTVRIVVAYVLAIWFNILAIDIQWENFPLNFWHQNLLLLLCPRNRSNIYHFIKTVPILVIEMTILIYNLCYISPPRACFHHFFLPLSLSLFQKSCLTRSVSHSLPFPSLTLSYFHIARYI